MVFGIGQNPEVGSSQVRGREKTTLEELSLSSLPHLLLAFSRSQVKQKEPSFHITTLVMPVPGVTAKLPLAQRIRTWGMVTFPGK